MNKKAKTRAKKKKKSRSKAKVLRVLKWMCIATVIVVAIVLFLMSSVFNVRNIQVEGNSKVGSDEIIRLSGITVDSNIFRINIMRTRRNIRTESYIGDVTIRRRLNGNVTIRVEERTQAFMLYLEGLYGYISSQGYILEISDEPLELPIINGFETEMTEIEPGNRLIQVDLIKLGTVIRIMDVAGTYNIAHLITSIDISDDQNYVLVLEEEGKIIHFGDNSRINQKILWIVACIERENGIDGELFLRDVNRPVFRERVIF
ncbi:MAG: FtsQ-type POTRA domain-containing protein [Oscillospiraceae bacterium]|nr:FtsQ-type POTRA domain-containing protein [Oscillospiraceae bacterium]